MFASPAVAGGSVYVSAFDRKLYAFDAAGITGCSGVPKVCNPQWTALPTPVASAMGISTPVVANGLVFVATGIGDHFIHAYEAAGGTNCTGAPKTCTPLWSGDVGSGVRSSPAVAGDYLYVGSEDNMRVFGLPVSADGAFHPVAPYRIFDTREEGGALAPSETRSLTLAGRVLIPASGVTSVVVNVAVTEPTLSLPVGGYGGVPADRAIAVVLNVAVTGPTTDGWLTLFPSGGARPIASSINFAPGQTVSNKVVVPLGVGWAVDIFNAHGDTHVVVDVEGWFGFPRSAPGVPYHPLTPAHVLDTRATVAVGPDGTLTPPLAAMGGAPATGVTAVVLNVAVTQPTTSGYLTVHPSGEARPLASSITFAQGETISNAVVAKVGADGSVKIYNAAGTTHVVVDVQGWFGL